MNCTKTLRILLLLVLPLAAAVPRAASAVVIFASVPGELQADETFDWSTVAGSVADPSNLTAGSVGFTLSAGGATLVAGSGSGFFLTNGNTHDILVRSLQPDALFRLDFSSGLFGFGAFVEWGGFELASYTISAFGLGNSLLFSNTIPSPGTAGEPAFLGVLSDTASIFAIELTATGATAPHSFAMDDPIFQVQAAAVPEPASFVLLGTALAGLALRRRRRAA